MAVATYTKTGNKATTPAKLDKSIFSVDPKNHELVKAAYDAYLANGRTNLAKTKTRGMVRASTRKHHQQKGTGRARAGAVSSPIWTGGGVTFGPSGQENYSKQLNVKAKRLALRQALTIKADNIKVVETFMNMEDKTKDMVKFLDKIEASGNVLCVVSKKDVSKERATQNIPNLKVSGALYLNVYDVMNADSIVMSQKALAIVTEWLGAAKAARPRKETK